MDCSLPGSSVHGILQARILEWVAIPSCRGSSWSRGWTHISYVSCICEQDLYHWCRLGSPSLSLNRSKSPVWRSFQLISYFKHRFNSLTVCCLLFRFTSCPFLLSPTSFEALWGKNCVLEIFWILVLFEYTLARTFFRIVPVDSREMGTIHPVLLSCDTFYDFTVWKTPKFGVRATQE